MSKNYKLLIMNLGSTSTKMAVWENSRVIFSLKLSHETDSRFQTFSDFWDQYDIRKSAILDVLEQRGHSLSSFDAIVSRGAPVRPMNSGCYSINSLMIEDAESGVYGKHPCSVGCKIAYDLAMELAIPALTVDAPCIDELIFQARFTGLKGIERKSFYQALNQKAIGRRLGEKLLKSYDEINAIIVHMGGGMSIAAHCKGKVIDVNNGLDGDGPMAPERAGTVPAGELLKLAYSGVYTYGELYSKINGRGGLYDLTGSKDGKEIEERIKMGDTKAKMAYDAMSYQIAKSIGAAAVTLKGQVDAIAFTGGLAYSDYLIRQISQWCDFLAPIHLFPGEDEMEALAEGAFMALMGTWPIQHYGEEEML